MPANLTPEYKKAEAAYRKARDTKERLDCLREMLRTIPKHKGTDHLQGDIKSRIKELTEELGGPRKGGVRGGPATVIHPEGAAQIALLGPPNAGKSALHDKLTGSGVESAPYPFTTQFPHPGMLPYEDVQLQLIDLPPLALGHPIPWLVNALTPADACLLVVDLNDPDCVDQVLAVHQVLAGKRITLTARWEDTMTADESEEEGMIDPFAVHLPTLMIAAKVDRISKIDEELQVFQELTGLDYPVIAASVISGEGLARIAPWLFEKLRVVRVYTKAPGRPPDKGKPFTVRRGQTVREVAALVHQELAESLRYARLWREGEAEGRQVGGDYPVADRDVVELHT